MGIVAQDLDKSGTGFEPVLQAQGPTIGWVKVNLPSAGPGMSGFTSVSAVQAATIAPSTGTINTTGYYADGDGGGAFYTRAGGSTPGGIQSADGAWWAVAVAPGAEGINVKQFGAKGDNVADDTVAINACFASLIGKGGLVIIPGGNYRITDTIIIGSKYGGANSLTSFINIRGYSGPNTLININYYGPDDPRPAVCFCKNKYFICEGITVQNFSGGTTSCKGMVLGGSGQVDTITFSGNVSANFQVGDNITGAISSAHGTVTSSSFSSPNTTVVANVTGPLNASIPFQIGEIISGPHGSAASTNVVHAGSPGTMTLSATFINCQVAGFNIGISDGNFGASSEIYWLGCSINNSANMGWTAIDFNTLDHIFTELSMGGNLIGLDTGACEGFRVYGGSATANSQADFRVNQNSTNTVISGFRSENASLANVMGGNVFSPSGGAGNVTVKDCNFRANNNWPNNCCVLGAFNFISIEDSQLDARIVFTAPPAKATIKNVLAPVDATTKLPFAFGNPGGFPSGQSSRVVAINNVNSYDFDGWVNGDSGFHNNIFGTGNILTAERLIVPSQTPSTPNVGAPYGADYQLLNGVRQLAEGPIPTLFNLPANISAVTNAASAAGTVNLYFASAPAGVVPGMAIVDQTRGGVIPNNTCVLNIWFPVSGGASVVCSRFLTGGGVLSGDTILFQPFAPNTLDSGAGRNLRIMGQFATSATLALGFTRSLNVQSGIPGTQFNATTGRFFPADVGKAITIPGKGNQGWTDYWGFIAQYVDSTHVQILSGSTVQQVPVVSPATSATIGTNEPDANYMVLVTGNVNETFWVDTITATGFTVHSSNATSTAVVTCLIVR
jgi:hypothetical protein